MSLNNLGDSYKESIPGQAIRYYKEALEIIKPFANTYPQAYTDRGRVYLEGYLAACKALGQQPDPAVLAGLENLLSADEGAKPE